MNVFELQKKLDDAGVPRCWYHIDGLPVPYCFTDEYMLQKEQRNDGKTVWVYFVVIDRRVKSDVHYFEAESEAFEFFYSIMTKSWEKYKSYFEHNEKFAKSYEDKEITRLLNRIHKKPVSRKFVYCYGFKRIQLINDTCELDAKIKMLLKDDKCSIDNKIKPNNEKYYKIVGRRLEITLDEMNGKWIVRNIRHGISENHLNLGELNSEADACTVFYYFFRRKY